MTTPGLSSATVLAGFNAAKASLPDSVVTITFGASTSEGVKTQSITNPNVADFGRMDDYRFSVRIPASDLTSLAVEDVVTIGGTSHLVLGIESDRVGATKLIHLGDEHA